MANPEIFKTAFKGYQKDEVVAYIENLNAQLMMLQNELNEAKSSLGIYEQERQETAMKQTPAEVDEEVLREKIMQEVISSMTEEIKAQAEEELRPVLEQELRQKIESEIVAKYEEAVRAELSNRLKDQAEEIAELRRRAQLYNENREVLAELMIQAKNDATGIIRDAEEYARALNRYGSMKHLQTFGKTE